MGRFQKFDNSWINAALSTILKTRLHPLIKLNYLNVTRVLFNYLFFNPLINSKYFIFCLIFCNYSVLVKLLARVKKNEFLHIIAQKPGPQLRCRFCIPIVTSTCNHMVTQITALTTLTPTRKLNGKPRVHTVFYMDSIGQGMPSLGHVKNTVFPLVWPFRLLSLSNFRHAPLVFDSCRARENYHVDRQLL